MGLLGKKSGFKSARDLILFLVGLGGIIPQIISVYNGQEVNIGALMFFGALAGAPYFMGKDEAE